MKGLTEEEMKSDWQGNKLVFGGSTISPSHTRCQQLSWDLLEVSEDVVNAYVEAIESATTFKDLEKVLLNMSSNNINIVGSRCYVYSSKAMADAVMHFDPHRANIITRGMGLRAKCFEIMGTEIWIEL